MPIGETTPTIAELKGNTILELFKSGYNALKNALTRKQNKLVAGDNIVIDETTNRISAIEGGTPVLDDYYTKSETDDLLDEKADVVDVYSKSEIDTKLGAKADSIDVYDKTEVDDLLDAKADVDDVYGKSEVYTKSETDDEIDAKIAQIPSVNAYTKTETDTLLSAKADKTDTYTKIEVDALVTPKADASTVYTKTEVNSLIASKANSSDVYGKSETYTKTEVDALVTPKANSSDVYSKTQVYTKTETDSLIQSQPIYHGLYRVNLTHTEELSSANRQLKINLNINELQTGDIIVCQINRNGSGSCNSVMFPYYAGCNESKTELNTTTNDVPGDVAKFYCNVHSQTPHIDFIYESSGSTTDLSSAVVLQMYVLRVI